jgi:hypothetical protein
MSTSTLPAVRGFSGHAVNLGQPLDLAEAAAREARLSTQDGHIWPVQRAAMVTRDTIRERMAEDLGAALREAGEFEAVCDGALLALGWTPEQVRIHGAAAARRVSAGPGIVRENGCGNDAAPASIGAVA